MITVKVVKEGYGRKPGQVLTLSEFDAGLLLAFGYAVNYEAPKPDLKVETQMVSQPEIRVEAIEQPVSFFKRRGRPKK